ncbi:MAG TPA: hypothetical protein VF587_14260 [Solirubrobacteraceae bacterium]|jgi:hypothetical protein
MHRILVVSLLLFAALVPSAHAVEYGNVVPVSVPAPKGDEVVLARVEVGVEISRRARPRPRGIGPLTVRRAGGAIPRGYAVTAVRARPRGRRVVVRVAAVRTSGGRVRSRIPFKLKVGTARAAFTGAQVRTVALDPDTRVRRLPECGAIGGEAEGWSLVRGLASVRIGGERFGARTTVGAGQQLACRRSIASVPVGAAERFLVAVHPGFRGGGGTAVEGFFATWARGADGAMRVCVYVRGRPRGTGDVTVATTSQAFTLDEDRGVALTQTTVPGDGEYLFTVRWRQFDGSFRETEGTIRVPAGGTRGDDPPAPYRAAGSCA